MSALPSVSSPSRPPEISSAPPKESTDGATAPFVSVVVTAHDRREFLRDAVESVLSQSVSPTEYEVIVVKFLHDEALDSWLESRRPHVRTVTDENLPKLGQKLARGIELARGQVVCFLEDDDRFLPGKLATVVARFRQDPSLVYYRNRNRFIDTAGNQLLGPYSRSLDRDLVLLPVEKSDRGVAVFIWYRGAEGNSSIAVRRSLADSLRPILSLFNAPTDRFLFVGALASSGSLVLSPALLSEHRAHGSLTQSANWASRRRFSEEIDRSGDALVEIARGTRAEPAARFLRARGAVSWYLMDPGAPRPTLERLRDLGWGAWWRVEPTFAVQLGWCGLRFLAPHVVSRAYWGYRQRDATRQRWRSIGTGPGSPPASPDPPITGPP